jgi:hypothetical protein
MASCSTRYDLVVLMTPAASVSFFSFRPEFGDFLYAPVGVDRNEMTLSVLSALARLDIDPWKEAAELSELAKHTAAQRLASLIARLPGGRWTRAESGAIADRLIELLPYHSPSQAPLAQRARGHPEMILSATVKILICAALVATALIIATSPEPSSRGDHTDVPASSSALPSRSQ